MEFKKVVSLLESGKNVKYFYFKFGLVVHDQVTSYELEGDSLTVNFASGRISVYADSKINECRRPSMLVDKEIKECYSLYGEYGDDIGYLYTK